MIEPHETILGALIEAQRNGRTVRGTVMAEREEGIYVRFAGDHRATLCQRRELSWPPAPANVLQMYPRRAY